jgi:DNA invertase Pin-like site-specific DNA recombinase
MSFFINSIINSFSGGNTSKNANDDFEMIETIPRSNNNFTKDIIIYCRVSTKEQDIASQKHECVQYCESNSFNVIETINEKCSAYRSNQPLLLNILQNNTNVNLLVHSVDRFSRNINSVDTFINLMETNNIVLNTVKGNIDISTAQGKFELRNLVLAAQYESELIGERVRRNVKYKRDNNILVGRAPYGYKYNKETKSLIRVDEEQFVIKFILRYVGKQMTLGNLTESLYALMKSLNLPESYFVPIEITTEDKKYTYKTFQKDDTIRITNILLCQVLNDYLIQRRGRNWTLRTMKMIIEIELKTFNNLKI